MRRSSTDESPYRRSPSLDSKPGSPPPCTFRRCSSPSAGLGFGPPHAPPAAQGKCSSPKGNRYVVFYLDLSFIFLLELQRCGLGKGCRTTIRTLMVLFNTSFWLGGCGVLGVGIWLAVTQGSFATLSASFPALSATNLLIATGAVIVVLGGLGCVGAVRASRVLLLTFFVLLLLIFLLELLSIILFLIYKEEIDHYAQAELQRGLHLFGSEGNVGLTNAWSIIQTDFRCCGVSNHTDWFPVYNTTRVPDSCCQEHSLDCGLEQPGTWWTEPCYKKVKMWLQENLLGLWISALCTGLTQVLALAFSMVLFCQVVKSDTFYT